MHLVVSDLLFLYRAERAKTHMQCDITHTNAHILHLSQQFFGKVQSRRGSGSASHHSGIYRLVSLAVLQLLFYIGRQRHFAQSVQHLQKNTVKVEPHQTVAVRQFLRNLAGQLAVTERHSCALAHFFAGTHQTLPRFITAVNQQQHLTGAASRQSLTQQPRRKHPGIIEDQTVSGMQIPGQIKKVTMLPRTGGLIQYQ